jgi:HlyD family secretion protein
MRVYKGGLSNMKKKIIIGILIAVIIGGAVYFKATGGRKGAYTNIKTSEVVKGDVKAYLSTTAVIKSKHSKDYFGQQLKISKLNVKIGDAVKKGQILLTYDVTDINNSIKQAEIQYNNAVLSKQILLNNDKQVKNKISDLNSQISDLDKQIEQYKNSANPADAAKVSALETQKKQLEQTKDSLKTSSSEQLKQADNAIALAQITLDSTKSKLGDGKENIIAEFDGVVTSVNVNEGGYGNPSIAAIVVQDIDNLKAVVALGKFDAAKIAINQEAEIKVNGNVAKGKVAFIDPVAKKTVSATGTDTTLNTEVDITENADGLKVDFDTDINILLGEKAGVIKVPAEAIKSDKTGRYYVYVVEGDKAVERTVTLGLQSEMEAEVLEGVKEGEKVILNPVAAIKEGSLVKENTEVGK